MLAMIGNRLVNLDHVQHIEPIPEAELPPNYGPEVRVTFADGATYEGGCTLNDLQDFRGLCGVVVPAPPGLVMVEQVPDFTADAGTGVAYVSSPVLAFRIIGAGAPVPIAVKGEPWPSSHVAVLHPDGTCESGGTAFASVEAWKAIFKPEPTAAAIEPGTEAEDGAEPRPDPAPKPVRH